MRLVFLGAPGVGKGTQAKLLCDALGLKHISTGDLLREAVQNETELGKTARDYMDRGDLVPDDVILGLIEETVEGLESGFVLDGFPRTEGQARGLSRLLESKGLDLDGVILLTAAEEEIIKRMSARGRADDTEATVKHRLEVYEKETRPLVDWYRREGKLTEVDGMGSIDDIHNRVLSAVRAHAG